MKTLQCMAAVVWMNLCALPQRAGTSLVMVVGIGGVVAVVVAVLAMVAGLVETMQNKGHEDRAVILRYGSSSETGSWVPRDAVPIIMDAPEVRRDARGRPIASMEVVRLVRVVRSRDNTVGTVALRGVGLENAALRPEVRIVQGRMFRPALNEVIVGQALIGPFKGLRPGSRVTTGRAQWTIVGVFASGGDPHESEMMTGVDTLMSAYQITDPNSIEVALKPGAFRGFVDTLSGHPQVHLTVMRERDYYASQSQAVSQLLGFLAFLVGSVMGLGAIFGALNTMYSAVSTRTREIATLRALGFGPAAIVVSVLVEALLLGVTGGVAGAALAWLIFDRVTASTVSGAVGTQIVFHMAVTPGVMAAGLAWATALGAVGGLLPALRAARLPVATALAAS